MPEVIPVIPQSGLTPPPVEPTTTTPSVDPAALAAPATLLEGEAKAEPTAPIPLDMAKLTLPEGMKADNPDLKSLSEIITSTGTDQQAQTQKLVDLYAKLSKANGEASIAAWAETNRQWADEVRADKEIGGAALEATVAKIRQVKGMSQFAVQGLDEALSMTGAGNNPAIVKFIAKLASAVTEGKHVSGSPATPSTAKSAAELLYPSMKTG